MPPHTTGGKLKGVTPIQGEGLGKNPQIFWEEESLGSYISGQAVGGWHPRGGEHPLADQPYSPP